jgi:hypothetical protein
MANVTNRGKYNMLTEDLAAATIEAMLLDETAFGSFDPDDNVANDIVAARLDSDETLTTVAATEDDTNDIAYIDADDPTWTAVAGGDDVIGCAIVRYVDGTDANDEYISYVSTTSTPTNGGDITINFSATEGFTKIS